MAINETAVSEHYTSGELLSRILKGIEASNIKLEELQPSDLAPVEEFHIGGRAATAHAVSHMKLTAQDHVLDIGCGIGGAARFIADQIGCSTTGIDLTPEFIETGKELNRLTKLTEKVALQTASALSLPFDDESFDHAITLHAAMNIADRPQLYKETARVLKSGGVFCVYDVMQTNDTPMAWPVPWAESAETSFLTSPEQTQALLSQAGFEIKSVEDRHDFAMAFFEQSLAAMKDNPPAMSLNLVMGESAPVKFKNMLENIKNGCISPVQIIATKQ